MAMAWMRWRRGWLAAGACLMTMQGSGALAEEHYLSATIDDQQQLHIVTTDNRDVQAKPARDQVGVQSATVCPDHLLIGYLALYRERGKADPVARELVIFRDGKVQRSFSGNGEPILTWSFEADCHQVAIFQNAKRRYGSHYELRDVRTGKRVAKYDENPGRDAPQWVLDVAN